MPINLLITGDYCPIGRNAQSIENGDYSMFGNFIPYVRNADLAVTNLESPLTLMSEEIKKTGPNIKSSPNAIKALSFAGFNLVTLANNHILDYGEAGVKDTIRHCKEEKINVVGAGENLVKAREPFITAINDVKIAILNFAENEFCAASENTSGANPINLITNYQDIKKTKQKVDCLIVVVHGGREHYQLPTPKQRERYRFYIDSGADIVIGHHTHCFSGYEFYNEKPIFYSLGNFIFDYKKKYQTGLWTQGYGVLFNLSKGGLDFELIPYWQGRTENEKLVLLDDQEKVRFENKIKQLNQIIDSDELFYSEWKSYLQTQKKDYYGMIFIRNKYIRAAIKKGLLFPFFFQSKEHKRLLLNIFRCESHQEIMMNILENNINTYL
ncbi:hypothetical protein AGMMS49574_19100 [Bacteroidia bacterium]|nr:hypothetical protein AGMMS49574_19100 [Bacteroidia bacterium]